MLAADKLVAAFGDRLPHITAMVKKHEVRAALPKC